MTEKLFTGTLNHNQNKTKAKLFSYFVLAIGDVGRLFVVVPDLPWDSSFFSVSLRRPESPVVVSVSMVSG